MIVRRREVLLTANEVAKAIDAYLVAHGVEITGARTIAMMTGLAGTPCAPAVVYVDPGGRIVHEGREAKG